MVPPTCSPTPQRTLSWRIAWAICPCCIYTDRVHRYKVLRCIYIWIRPTWLPRESLDFPCECWGRVSFSCICGRRFTTRTTSGAPTFLILFNELFWACLWGVSRLRYLIWGDLPNRGQQHSGVLNWIKWWAAFITSWLRIHCDQLPPWAPHLQGLYLPTVSQNEHALSSRFAKQREFRIVLST